MSLPRKLIGSIKEKRGEIAMAEVQVVIHDVEGNRCDLEMESKVKEFITKFDSELGDLASNFYTKDDEAKQLGILEALGDQELSTRESGGEEILNLLSKTTENTGFSFGYSGFTREFYKELFQIVPDLNVNFNVTVIGQGDEFYKVDYGLHKDGWTVNFVLLYAWDEEQEDYLLKDD
jgi:hypothetical protein